MAFLDLSKAYDKINHRLIWTALRFHNIPEQYITTIQNMYTNNTTKVRTAAGTSNAFDTKVGVAQGSSLSPLLFVLCMNYTVQAILEPHPWTLLYADDVVICDKSKDSLEKKVEAWKELFDRAGFRLNVEKSEYLEVGEQTTQTVAIDGKDLPKTQSFKYLGSHICSDGSIDAAVNTRISNAWMKWKDCTSILCDRKMPDRLKGKCYRSIVRPVALYGTETWAMNARAAARLSTMEMKMIRWSFGHTRLDKIRNEIHRRRAGIAPILEKAREQRLRWYGHVLRQERDAVARHALEMEVKEGKRSRGRPKLRWEDVINKDMKEIKTTKEKALDRKYWRRRIHVADPKPNRD